MISDCLNVIKYIFELCEKQLKKSENDKALVSSFLLEISNILEDTHSKLIKDEYPHNHCVVLERLSEKLCDVLQYYVDKNEVDILYQKLLESSQIEKLFYEREDKTKLEELQKTAGEFKVLSMTIKL